MCRCKESVARHAHDGLRHFAFVPLVHIVQDCLQTTTQNSGFFKDPSRWIRSPLVHLDQISQWIAGLKAYCASLLLWCFAVKLHLAYGAVWPGTKAHVYDMISCLPWKDVSRVSKSQST